MKTYAYSTGAAAVYAAWLERQDDPKLHALASRFRPWEIYSLDGGSRGLLVRVVGHEASDIVNLLHVQYLNNPHRPEGVITVVDHQLELWGVLGFDTIPAKEAA
jgi:hypothetical protein